MVDRSVQKPLAALKKNPAFLGKGHSLTRLFQYRADPIVNPGKVAGHLHTIMGGNGFDFTMDYEQALNSTCSTCAVTKDLSNYWTPSLF